MSIIVEIVVYENKKQLHDDSPGNSEHDHKNDAPLPYSFVLVLGAVALGFALTRKNKTV